MEQARRESESREIASREAIDKEAKEREEEYLHRRADAMRRAQEHRRHIKTRRERKAWVS